MTFLFWSFILEINFLKRNTKFTERGKKRQKHHVGKQFLFIFRNSIMAQSTIINWTRFLFVCIFIFKAFIRDCPHGQFDEKYLAQLCLRSYPDGDSEQFARFIIRTSQRKKVFNSRFSPVFRYLFRAIDNQKNKKIDFLAFMIHINVMLNGNEDDRIGLAFDMFVLRKNVETEKKLRFFNSRCDQKKRGFINAEDLANILFAMVN